MKALLGFWKRRALEKEIMVLRQEHHICAVRALMAPDADTFDQHMDAARAKTAEIKRVEDRLMRLRGWY